MLILSQLDVRLKDNFIYLKLYLSFVQLNTITCMKNMYCLFQVKFITGYLNVQHVIITQI
jgi:hypothetical protein